MKTTKIFACLFLTVCALFYSVLSTQAQTPGKTVAGLEESENLEDMIKKLLRDDSRLASSPR